MNVTIIFVRLQIYSTLIQMSLSDIILVLITAMIPIGELRLAIPLAIFSMEIDWYIALPVAIIGNLLPVIIILSCLDRVSTFLTSFENPLGSLILWYERRILAIHSAKFQKYGAMALILLVAIPLPMTGAWTGSFASWLFNIPTRKAFILISIGLFIAGGIVTIISIAGFTLFISDTKI
tara:strand:+ start:545 stop:1081 length:537 start_codon:yes stop_codon:yes gene_type:complete